MTVEFSVYQAELVFQVTPQIERSKILDALQGVHGQHDAPLEIGSTAPDKWQVSLDGARIRLQLEHEDACGQRLRISTRALGRAAAREDEDDVLRTLALVAASLARAFRAESVHWLKRETRVPTADFISAVLGEEDAEAFARAQAEPESVAAEAVSPRRVTLHSGRARRRPARAEPHMQATERLRMHYKMLDAEREEAALAEPQLSLPLRLTAWAMTVMVAVFSVPLAWVLFAYNLRRGTDFRATTHVLALISSFSILHSAGGTAQLYQMLFS